MNQKGRQPKAKRPPIAPIGEFLQKVDALDPASREKVLKLQKKYPSKTFGQIALEKGYVQDELTKKYLTHKGFF